MRKYLDIPLTVVVTTVLTIAMLWPLEAAPRSARGERQTDTLHRLRGSRLPIGPHRTFRPAASVYWRERL